MDKKYDVLTICNALVDMIYKAEDMELAQFNLRKGEMHLVETDRQLSMLQHFSARDCTIETGGSSLNAMRAVAMLGKKPVFAGMVGHDHYGHVIRKRLEELKIKAHLYETKEDHTGTCLVLVTQDGERTMNTHLGASRLYAKDIIPDDDVRNSKVFHFSGYQWDTEDQKETILETLKLAKETNSKISFDLADPFVVRTHREDFVKVLEDFADIVFANEEEAKLLYEGSPEAAAKKIAETGAVAVIKLGARGALIQDSEKSIAVPAVPTTVLDTTGAGDMFAGGFLAAYVSQLTLKECGDLGALLASDVISRYGAQLSEPVIAKARESFSL